MILAFTLCALSGALLMLAFLKLSWTALGICVVALIMLSGYLLADWSHYDRS